jgi:hypothetical protein
MMEKLLKDISKRAFLLNEFDFTEESKEKKWLGYQPASDEEIASAEATLQVKFPNDYIEFLKTTNGFPQFITTGVTFLPVTEVDYLLNINEDLVEIWSQEGLNDIGDALSQSLLVGGLNEEQQFY